MTIDYSEWHTPDTDSEPEPSPPSVPRPQRIVPSRLVHRPVQGVIVRCNFGRTRYRPWSATTITTDHTIFSNTGPSIPRLIEIPLVFHPMVTAYAIPNNRDNQMITYLHIDDKTGIAPVLWQSDVGTIMVAREDQKDLLPQHLEGISKYCDHIFGLFESGNGALTHLYNRRSFEECWNGYRNQQMNLRSGTGGKDDPEDWLYVPSPYEM